MKIGTSFFRSKIARRFCLLFLLCAFLPTVILVFIAYDRVGKQLEEQSLVRLKRETKSYSLALYDRMIRLQQELENLSRESIDANPENPLFPKDNGKQLQELFTGIIRLDPDWASKPIYGSIDLQSLQRVLDDTRLHDAKPFALAVPQENVPAKVFMGINVMDGAKNGKYLFSIVGEVQISYFWGVGATPLLPPATDLTVYDGAGNNIMGSGHSPLGKFQDIDRKYIKTSDLQLFQYDLDGETYFGNFSNLFVESRFQRNSWTIVLSQAQDNMMRSLAEFKKTFPFIILFFLLLILYLSFSFIRRGLEPLAELKKGTRRIAMKDFSRPVEIYSRDEFEELGTAFNTMSSQLQKQFNTLIALNEIDRSILSSVDKIDIVTTTLGQLKEFFHADVTIYLKNSETAPGRVKTYLMKGRRKDDPEIRFLEISPEEREILLLSPEDIILLDAENSICNMLHMLAGMEFATILVLPVRVEREINRTAILCWQKKRVVTDDEQAQARQIANQLAVGLTNAGLVEDLEKLAIGTIEALARTVDAKSKWTAGHSERVAELSAQIAKVLGFSLKEIDALTRAALLHDIGKIGIPLAILDKPGKLTDEEYSEIKRHPEIGYQILEPIEVYRDFLPVVVQHHEKYDGTGYPRGLEGEEIDLRARILAVADVWDAVVSNRPYRDGWVAERARKLIVENSGTHFDPKVVDAFFTAIEKG